MQRFVFFVTLSSLSFLSGCSVLGGVSSGGPTMTTYVLNSTLNESSGELRKDSANEPSRESNNKANNKANRDDITHSDDAFSNRSATRLALARIRSSSFDDRDSLVFAHQENTRATYQYAQWSEKPSRRLDELVFAHLEQSGLYQTLVPARANVRTQHLLVSELLEFYHDATQSPGLVNVKMRFSLYDQSTATLLSRKTLHTQSKLQQFDAPSAAVAFNQATAKLLAELSFWLEQVSLKR